MQEESRSDPTSSHPILPFLPCKSSPSSQTQGCNDCTTYIQHTLHSPSLSLSHSVSSSLFLTHMICTPSLRVSSLSRFTFRGPNHPMVRPFLYPLSAFPFFILLSPQPSHQSHHLTSQEEIIILSPSCSLFLPSCRSVLSLSRLEIVFLTFTHLSGKLREWMNKIERRNKAHSFTKHKHLNEWKGTSCVWKWIWKMNRNHHSWERKEGKLIDQLSHKETRVADDDSRYVMKGNKDSRLESQSGKENFLQYLSCFTLR